MSNPSDLIDRAKFILGNAHTRLESIRRGSNLNPNDIWVALEYIEAAQARLNEANTAFGELMSKVHCDSGFRNLDETLQAEIEVLV